MTKDIIKAYCASANIPLDDEKAAKFEELTRLLLEYNSHTNLTAIRDEEGVAVKHHGRLARTSRLRIRAYPRGRTCCRRRLRRRLSGTSALRDAPRHTHDLHRQHRQKAPLHEKCGCGSRTRRGQDRVPHGTCPRKLSPPTVAVRAATLWFPVPWRLCRCFASFAFLS